MSCLPIHCIDLVRLLHSRGHEIHFYNVSSEPTNDPLGLFSQYTTVLPFLFDIHQYDMWMYDLSSWETPKSPLLSLLECFRGNLVCLNYEDGHQFFLNRSSSEVINKTKLYVNNQLRTDHDRYDSRIREKLFLSNSYISNSQDFKNLSVPFRQKMQRAIFTGNITGHSETGNQNEKKCRIKIPITLINSGVPCFYKIYNSDPNYRKLLKEVPEIYRQGSLPRKEFIEETINSMIILSLRGNGHTVNRFFEGQASGGLIFSTKFRHIVDFIGHGEAGKDYVEIEWDGSDVVDKAKYYFEHIDQAEKIAANGRKIWEEFSMLDENYMLPKKMQYYYVNGFQTIAGITI